MKDDTYNMTTIFIADLEVMKSFLSKHSTKITLNTSEECGSGSKRIKKPKNFLKKVKFLFPYQAY